MIHVKCSGVSNVLANTAVAIFSANVYWGFRKPYIEQAVVSEWDVTYMIAEQRSRLLSNQ
jgi:hypothetical protein